MKNLIIALILVFNMVDAQNNQNFVKNNLIIKINEEYFKLQKVNLPENKIGVEWIDNFNKLSRLKKIEPLGNFKKTRTFLLVFDEDKKANLELEKYKMMKGVEFCELNYICEVGGKLLHNSTLITPTDANFNKQWGLFNNGTMTGIGDVLPDADVDMELAWNIETGDPNMIIAVSDSGLKMNHPDIASRIWVNSSEIAGNGTDDDNNGYIDDVNGWDWVNADNNPTDDHGHGTNCTGIIGEIANNNMLFAGANWNSKIMPLKVLNSTGNGTYFDMANSIYYSVDNGAKIVSMSIGGTSNSTTMSNSMAYANDHNVMLFFCMMNTNNNVSYYPARYSLSFPNVVAVGSTSPDDTRTNPFPWSATSGSNYGTHINVVAPGNYIYSLNHTSNTNSTTYWSGTSQATPLVASIASLIFAINPILTPLEVRNILQNTAQDQVGTITEDVAGFDQYMGYGRVNAFSALQAATATLDVNQNEFIQEFSVINPVQSNQLLINSGGIYEDKYELTFYTMDGKVLFSINKEMTKGINTILFDYPSGNYILSLKSERYSKVIKISKL
jgi:thermitase